MIEISSEEQAERLLGSAGLELFQCYGPFFHTSLGKRELEQKNKSLRVQMLAQQSKFDSRLSEFNDALTIQLGEIDRLRKLAKRRGKEMRALQDKLESIRSAPL